MNVMQQMQENLKAEIRQAVLAANVASESEILAVVLEQPKDKAHGDYATNIAMQLAKVAKKAPRQIAEDIVAHIDQSKGSIKSVDIAGPGFINFFIDNQYLTKLIPTILEQQENYGSSDTGKGEKVQVEFVSANPPTGDLHLGHARGASVGGYIV
ncbi:arginyl-tRNA synthetase [Gracilibacillus boraciitolerans JCM 21714]|uniref:Arginyl-tRNA synthetase n=1 Tax=Gracilibacillus boraciitolerans JCM 21714 TaxID=1298598 RepID=W4VGM3_9BACI|nr:arginyl-tRNA synthetase [Gracilibacillus boraciitolerans JCM 21714]